MATSGTVLGNSIDSGRKYVYINWQLATQEIGNNRSLINFQAYARFINSDSQLDDSRVFYNDGAEHDVVRNTGRVYNYAGNFSNHDVALGSGSFWVNHDSAGNKSFGLGGSVSYYGTGYSSGYQVWDLPNIPRHCVLNSAPDFWDTQDPTINYSNPAGTAVDFYIETPYSSVATGGIIGRSLGSGGGGNYTIALTSAERIALLARCPNNNTMTVRFVIHDTLGGVNSWSTIDRTMTVVNGEPTFTDYSYRDSNSTTSTITGNDQYLIQGYSTLEMKVIAANKAIANKQSTMVKYNSQISSVNIDSTYSSSADVTQALGVIGTNADTPLVVKAVDSRGNSTPVTKTIKVVPYVVPNVVATARRVNNFETSTNIHIEGTVSRLTVATVDKNTVNATSGVQYRYKKTTDSTWSSWTNRASSLSAGNVTTTDFAINLDRNYSWNLEVTITDKITTSTLAIVVPIGTPIFRVSTYDNLVYNNEQPLMPSHIGMVITTVALTTAAAVQAIYGGTWAAWGVGRTPVGVDTTQTEFNTVEKTGGDKNLQAHTHAPGSLQLIANVGNYANGQTNLDDFAGSAGPISASNVQVGNYFNGNTASTGAGSSQNLQPYITAYMWKRTA